MIKFRAWWMEQEIMCDVDAIGFSEGAITVSNENTTYKHLGLNEVKLMQCTGLKDKNNIEIYEGDIVVSHAGDIWVITYFRGAFRYYPIESFSKEKEIWFETDNIGNFGTEAFEVIGNIQENIELTEVAE